MRPISPSQVKAFRICPRRFTFRYVDGMADPAGEAAEHGRFIHTQMENWTLRGKRPTHPHALVMVPHAPRPLTALAERRVEWPSVFGLNPWTHLGVLDFTAVLESLATMRTSPFLVPGAPILFGDYKTTSNFKYALEPYKGVLVDRETLEPDPQFAMYSDYFYTNGWTDLTAKWIYSRTTGKAKALPVVIRPERAAVDDAMGGVTRDSQAIYQLYKIRPKGNEVPYNLGGCRAFNKPCPHLLYCNLPSRRANFDALSEPDAPEGDIKMGMAETIMSTFPGDPNDEPPVEHDDMPDDFGEEGPDLDLPPEEAEDGRGELSDEEQLKVMAEVERGFVNPLEAPERAAATPEENFAMHGDPVVEKRKFGKDDKPALLAFAIANGIVEKGSRLAAAGLAKAIAVKGFNPAEVADNGATTVAEVKTERTSAKKDAPKRAPEDQGALDATVPDEPPIEDVEEECGSDEPGFDGPPLTEEEERSFNEPLVMERAELPIELGGPAPTVPDGVLPSGRLYTAEDLRSVFKSRETPVLTTLSDEQLQEGLKSAVETSKRFLEVEAARAKEIAQSYGVEATPEREALHVARSKARAAQREMIDAVATGKIDAYDPHPLESDHGVDAQVEDAARVVGATMRSLARALGGKITVSFSAED